MQIIKAFLLAPSRTETLTKRVGPCRRAKLIWADLNGVDYGED